MSSHEYGSIPQPDEVCTVLAVNLDEEHFATLAGLIRGYNWGLARVATCREAWLRCRGLELSIVLCAPRMPDGDWRSLLSRLEELPNAPAVIVASRLAEEHLWGEVLNLGGYDVLPLPFDRSELLRVLFLAWCSRRRQPATAASARRMTLGPPPAPPPSRAVA